MKLLHCFYSLSLLGLSLTSSAQEVHPSITNVREQCISRSDWSTRQCVVYNETGEQYQNDLFTNVTFGLAQTVIYPPMEFVGGLMDTAENLGHLLSGDGERVMDESVRQTIWRELSYVRQFNSMNECQDACLIKCAASAILDWEENERTKWGATNNSYTGGTGVCTEFSRVAVDLGDAFGVPVRMSVGPGHAFNSFEINGRWYVGEPQNDSCRFFVRESTTSEERRRYTREINGGPRRPRLYTPSSTNDSSARESSGVRR